MALELPLDIETVKGFLSSDEGELLYRCALELESRLPALEIGSYCGKSTVYLGLACRTAGRQLFALDHHRGSEEHQPGELFHDAELTNSDGEFDTLASFRRTLRQAGLEDAVTPVLATSKQFSNAWQGQLCLVFIDGGHSLKSALEDYRGWAGHITRGGLLAIHDVYAKPEDGGQAPIAIYRMALASGLFEDSAAAGSLRVLRRL